ncbi:MAG: sigma-54-dependent Fis family transcriptional regulator [Lewinella sp.]|nr:sigma-54-dependent Fis family transcriptional regulator [Lewinella sp.]
MSTKNHHILIVDDDPEFHQQIRYAFRRQFIFSGAVGREQLFRKLKEEGDSFDLLLLDMVFDDSLEKQGLAIIPELRQAYPRLPVIVVTADRAIDTVVEAMKLGARDFLVKGDFDFTFWQRKFADTIRDSRLQVENEALKAEVKRHRAAVVEGYPFVGESAQIQEIKRILRLVSEEPEVTVLLTGETGTGKEVAARYLHAHGARKEKPFQAVNLSAIQDTLLESTLFGHKKGAFTGAARDMEGYFYQANGGILMLDEIGDIDQNIQIKLLRFLETKLIRPVGADQDIQLDVQVVAATHRHLDKAVQEGRFRADLYQRLKAMVITLPPLRSRRDDIPHLLHYYFGVDDLGLVMEPAVFDKLLAYHWEGNIRELKNAVSYMQLRAKILDRRRIDLACLPAEILSASHAPQVTPVPNGTPPGGVMTDGPTARNIAEEHALVDLERIEQLLIQKNGVKKDVAEVLGLENTDNLRYRIKKHYDKHPHLFAHFPAISRRYRRIVK